MLMSTLTIYGDMHGDYFLLRLFTSLSLPPSASVLLILFPNSPLLPIIFSSRPLFTSLHKFLPFFPATSPPLLSG